MPDVTIAGATYPDVKKVLLKTSDGEDIIYNIRNVGDGVECLEYIEEDDSYISRYTIEEIQSMYNDEIPLFFCREQLWTEPTLEDGNLVVEALFFEGLEWLYKDKFTIHADKTVDAEWDDGIRIVDTSEDTVTPADVVSGVSFHNSNGETQVGAIGNYTPDISMGRMYNQCIFEDSEASMMETYKLVSMLPYGDDKKWFDWENPITIVLDKDNFGDAEPSDVAEGKTFTSTNGRLLTGTAISASDIPFKYGGKNAELVDEYSESWTLADTSFVIGESASTSATNIKGAMGNRFTSKAISIGDKDVVVVQECLVTPTHSADAVQKAMHIRTAYVKISYMSKRKTNDTSSKTTRQIMSFTTGITKYYSTNSVLARVNATNYGFYATMSDATIANASASSTYIRVSSPPLYYRVSTTYESATNIKLVTECTYEWKVKVYLVDKESTVLATLNDDVDDIIVNGM